MRYAMAIDLDRCIGCRTCAVVCKCFNSQPQGIWWNRVFTSGTPEYDVAVKVDDQLRMEFVPLSCQHCTNAPCLHRHGHGHGAHRLRSLHRVPHVRECMPLRRSPIQLERSCEDGGP